MHTMASKGRMLQRETRDTLGSKSFFYRKYVLDMIKKGREERYVKEREGKKLKGTTHLFMKLTMYTMRGVQIMGWSVRMALMHCFTQNSGLRGGGKGQTPFF